jgi:Amt family ammonium transporter
MLTSSVLVLFMTLPGLALFYGGLVRTKNVLSILMQCFSITCLVTLAWVVIGYSIAFGDAAAQLRGTAASDKLSCRDRREDVKGSIPETVFAMFQLTFAIIHSRPRHRRLRGARALFRMLLFSLLWLLLVYCPVAHWVWGTAGCEEWESWISRRHGRAPERGHRGTRLRLVLGRRRGFPKLRCRRTTSP